MRVDFSKRAADAARNLQQKPARQIAAQISRLRIDPYPQHCKKLHGSDVFRVDSGEYRIIYRVGKEADPRTGSEEPVLHVDAIGKRNDDEVHRRFRKK